MATRVELLEPHIASHMDIGNLVGGAFLVVAHPLLHHAALYNKCVGRASARVLILELCEP